MKFKIIIISVFIHFIIIHLGAQDRPRMLNFDDFAPYLQFESDTVYIINFWATWCAPCVKEIPAFEKIRNDYNNHKVRVILVSLDFPNQIETRLMPFLKNYSVSSEVLVLNDPDSNRWIDKVHTDWSGAIPATLIYDNKNRELYEKSFTYDELKTIINSKIN